MTKPASENHNWKDNPQHVVALFKLVKEHIDRYDRNKWALKNKFTPADWNTADSKVALDSIVEDLIIVYDDETFSAGGCEMMIKNAISIQDNRDVPQNLKVSARIGALEAGFISDDDLEYITLMDDPDNNINFKIVNGELTPEQLLEHFDNPLAKNILMYQYPMYHKGVAFTTVLKLHNLKLKDMPKYIKDEALAVMKDVDNAFTQFVKSKAIIEPYVLKTMVAA